MINQDFAQTIVLHLVPSVIVESVKTETYIKGKSDSASNENARTYGSNEQAGDEAFHERKLQRTLLTSVEEFKTLVSDYLISLGWTSGDNVTIMSDTEYSADSLDISLKVSRRFNDSFVQSLARLAAKFIEDTMLKIWYAPINQELAAFYEQLIQSDVTSIRRCFSKSAPAVPFVPYTTQITLQGSTIDMVVGDTETVTYSIDEYSVDDIEARVDNMRIATIDRTTEGFVIKARYVGVTNVTLYSRHDTTVSATIRVRITTE